MNENLCDLRVRTVLAFLQCLLVIGKLLKFDQEIFVKTLLFLESYPLLMKFADFIFFTRKVVWVSKHVRFEILISIVVVCWEINGLGITQNIYLSRSGYSFLFLWILLLYFFELCVYCLYRIFTLLSGVSNQLRLFVIIQVVFKASAEQFTFIQYLVLNHNFSNLFIHRANNVFKCRVQVSVPFRFDNQLPWPLLLMRWLILG